MLEEFITNKSKDIVSDAYIKLYEETEPTYTLRTFNVFSSQYLNSHKIDMAKGYQGLLQFGERKAEVFKKYVDRAIYKYNKHRD